MQISPEIEKCWMWISENLILLGFHPKKIFKIFACHGLTSDQDMQRVLEIWVAYPKFSKVLCMSRSDRRPGHAKGLRNLGCFP